MYTSLYIGVYEAAHMSNGLCSSYLTSHASVGVFSHTERILRVYNKCKMVLLTFSSKSHIKEVQRDGIGILK